MAVAAFIGVALAGQRNSVATSNPTHVLRFFLIPRLCGVLYVFINQRKEKRKRIMNFDNDEDALGFINRLLERLHLLENEKIEKLKNESKIEVVYVASGGQHVETQINVETQQPLPTPLQKEREPRLPEMLSTEEAMALWEKVKRAGYVDAHYQPLISRTQSALLADAMAERLGIREKWKVFEALWNRKYMRSDYNLALTRKQSLDFQDELKRVFV